MSLVLPNTGLHLEDTDASHVLKIAPGSDITAARTLTLTTGDADRSITLSGSPTLNDWFDQSVKQAASPTFAGLTVSGNAGIGTASPAGKFHVDQSASDGAIPVLVLDQADVDQVLLKIIGTADAASTDRTLVANSDYDTMGAIAGYVQIEIQDDGNRITDGDYYIPFLTAPT